MLQNVIILNVENLLRYKKFPLNKSFRRVPTAKQAWARLLNLQVAEPKLIITKNDTTPICANLRFVNMVYSNKTIASKFRSNIF